MRYKITIAAKFHYQDSGGVDGANDLSLGYETVIKNQIGRSPGGDTARRRHSSAAGAGVLGVTVRESGLLLSASMAYIFASKRSRYLIMCRAKCPSQGPSHARGSGHRD